jgi:hypothetical protein
MGQNQHGKNNDEGSPQKMQLIIQINLWWYIYYEWF